MDAPTSFGEATVLGIRLPGLNCHEVVEQTYASDLGADEYLSELQLRGVHGQAARAGAAGAPERPLRLTVGSPVLDPGRGRDTACGAGPVYDVGANGVEVYVGSLRGKPDLPFGLQTLTTVHGMVSAFAVVGLAVILAAMGIVGILTRIKEAPPGCAPSSRRT